MKKKQLEILAPAGDPESLEAAIKSGADAVYLGSSGLLNARRGAVNFRPDQLREAVSYCHSVSAKVYYTLNTLVKEGEIAALIDEAEMISEKGVDAVLIQDLASMKVLKEACPTMPIHASTQMGITDLEGVLMAEELGFSRVVLGRELSIDEMKEIRKFSSLELEVFVHGALCMSISGQCYLSSMIGARSGNRGLCAQPCRLPFSIGKSENALSLKDMCLLDHVDELKSIGIDSLKIEGRMKRPEYVAAAVSSYRAALDGQEYDKDKLTSVFSRSGFTDGYFTGQRDSQMFGIRRKEDVLSATDKLLRDLRNQYKDEKARIALDFDLTLKEGQFPVLKLSDDDGFRTRIEGDMKAEPAINLALSHEKVQKSLAKTGGTIFYMRDFIAAIDENISLPVSQLNSLRRMALEKHLLLRSTIKSKAFNRKNIEKVKATKAELLNKQSPTSQIRIGRPDQIEAVYKANPSMIIIPLHLYESINEDIIIDLRDRLAIELPAYIFGSDDLLAERLLEIGNKGIDKALVSSLSSLKIARDTGFDLHGGHTLNISNSYALDEYRKLGLKSAVLSFENTVNELADIEPVIPCGLLAYGYLPLMALRNCPGQAHGKGCAPNCSYPVLTDRKGKDFFLDCDGRVSTMHNCVPMWMADRSKALDKFDFHTIYLTKESPRETERLISAFKEGDSFEEFSGNRDFTRGLYFRREGESGNR